MKINNRTYLKEDQTVNEVQLKDLYDLASKTEVTIINLAQTAINFSDLAIKNKALALKSQANELVTMIGNTMTTPPTDVVADVPVEEPIGEKGPLEQPNPDAKVIESTQIKESKATLYKQLKTLVESLDPELLLDEEPTDVETPDENINLQKDENPDDNTIDLSGPYMEIFDSADDIDFENFKQAVVQILNSTKFANDSEFINIINQISQVMDADAFDTIMDQFYDWADSNNVNVYTI